MTGSSTRPGAGTRIRRIPRIVVRNLRQKLEAPQPVGSVIANELGVGYRLRVEG
jgi:DNA-binding response OmpR family regulator